MQIVDICVVGLYLGMMIWIGYASGKKNETQEDYFLARRSMPWVPIALSVAATMISANGFIGGPGWSYQEGMLPFMVNIAVPLAIFFALWVSAPVMYYLQVTSIYQYMELRLGNKSRLLVVLQYFINSVIQLSSMVYIPVLIIHMMTGWSIYLLVPVVVLISIFYTMLGGIRAVIWTDTLQMVIVIGGVFLVIFTALQGTHLGFFQTFAEARLAGKFNVLEFQWDVTLPHTFWATLLGGSFMWIRYFCFDQTQVQRVLTARSLKQMKNSFVLSAVIMNLVYALMLCIGVILYVFYHGKSFDSSNAIMITFILEELPVGIIGLMIAAIFASAMSSIDSLLNSMSAVFTKDIYEYYFSKNDAQASLKMSKIITVGIGVLVSAVIFLAFQGSTRSILDTVGRYISYFAGPAAGVFLLALFTQKAHDLGVALGFFVGLIGGFGISSLWHTSWLWNPLIGGVLTMTSGYIFSIVFPTEQKPEDICGYTAMGIRKKLIEDGVDQKEGRSALPFSIGSQEIIVLCFFLFQYVFWRMIQYR